MTQSILKVASECYLGQLLLTEMTKIAEQFIILYVDRGGGMKCFEWIIKKLSDLAMKNSAAHGGYSSPPTKMSGIFI